LGGDLYERQQRETREDVMLRLASVALEGSGCPPRHFEAIQEFDAMAATASASGDVATLRAARLAARQVCEHIGEFLRETQLDMSSVVLTLRQLLRGAADHGTQTALIGALSSAARSAHEPTGASATEALAEAAGIDWGDATSVEGNFREAVRALSLAMDGPYPRNAERATELLVQVYSSSDGKNFTDVVASGMAFMLQSCGEASLGVAVERLLTLAQGSDQSIRDFIMDVFHLGVQHSSKQRGELVIKTLLTVVSRWESSRQHSTLRDLQMWFVERPPLGVGKAFLHAVSKAGKDIPDEAFHLVLVDVLIRAFEESMDDELERPALMALRSVATASWGQAEAVHIRVVDALHRARGLWFGTIQRDNIMRCMRTLTDIGVATTSAAVKRSSVDGLAQCMWEVSQSEVSRSMRAQLAVDGIAEVARTSRDPGLWQVVVLTCAETWTKRPYPSVRRAVLGALGLGMRRDPELVGESPALTLEIVRMVDALLLGSTQSGVVTRAMEWLILEVLAVWKDPSVRQGVLQASASLAVVDRVELAIESLYQILIEGWEGTEREGFRQFAAGIIGSCSMKCIRLALVASTRLAAERRLTWVKKEMAGWLGGALRITKDMEVAHCIVDGLMHMALRGDRTEESVRLRVAQELVPVLEAPTHETIKLAMAGLVQISLTCQESATALFVVGAVRAKSNSSDTQVVRFVSRALAKMAADSQHAEVRRSLAQALVPLLVGPDVVVAQAAIRGVIAGSAHVDEDFHVQVSAGIATAQQQVQSPELRAELADAAATLLNIAEMRLQEANSASSARNAAPAA